MSGVDCDRVVWAAAAVATQDSVGEFVPQSDHFGLRMDSRTDNAEEFAHFARSVSRIAYKCGKIGVKRKRALGPDGQLVQAVHWDLEMRTALARRQSLRRELSLVAATASIEVDIKTYELRAKAYDRRSVDIQDELSEKRRLLAAKRAQIEGLPRGPYRRGGASIAAGSAVAGIAIADLAALVLTVNGAGGTVIARSLVALGVVVALNIGVVAVSRMLESHFHNMRSRGPQWVSAAMIASVVLTLLGALAKPITPADDSRRRATANITHAFPINPEFLVCIGLAAALGATIALALWRDSAEARRLMRQVEEIERSLAGMHERQRELVSLAIAARDSAADLVASVRRMRASLISLSSELSHEVDELRARSNSLVELAGIRFEEGRLSRARKMKPPPTFDPDLDVWLQGQITGLGDRDLEGPPRGSRGSDR